MTQSLKPQPLPARGGLHPMRVGRKLKISEARALEMSLGAWICANVPKLTVAELEAAFAHGDVLTAAGEKLTWDTPASVLQRPIFMYRKAADEDGNLPEIPIVHQGDGWLVVNKPQGLATMPRGAYVARTVTVALRRQLNNPDLTPAHRLDRATGGLLLFTARRELRGAYQEMFARREVQKTYRAVADPLPLKFVAHSLHTPLTVLTDPPEKPGWVRVTSRIEKEHGVMAAQIVPGEPNALTYLRPTAARVQLAGREFVVYEVTPHTGKTHQIRLHFAALGIPLVGDPLYQGFNAAPFEVDQPPAGTTSLQLTATGLDFTDPQTGEAVTIRL